MSPPALLAAALTAALLAGTAGSAGGAGDAPAASGDAGARAAAAAVRVDRLTAEFRRHSDAAAASAAGLGAAYARIAAADEAAEGSGDRLTRARAGRTSRALALYAFGAAADPHLALLTAGSPEDGLWQLEMGVPLGERMLGAAEREVRAARAGSVLDAATAARVSEAATGLTLALRALRDSEDSARLALEAARTELSRLDAAARQEEAARAAAARLAAAETDGTGPGGTGAGPAGAVPAIGIPAEFGQAYHEAATTCPGLDWTLLAAVGQVESGHGRNNGPSSAGAIGPMQFMPGTFAAYGTDGDGDGAASAWDPQDAIFSAARYLCASGAGAGAAGVRRALFAYNHAQWYVDLVLAARASIAARAAG